MKHQLEQATPDFNPASIDSSMQTTEKISGLLRFIPFFEPPQDPVLRWKAEHFPTPVYHEYVEDFFREVSTICSIYGELEKDSAQHLLYDDALLATADIYTVRALLAYCLKGEQFLDGHWVQLIRDGRITALLCRIKTLCNSP